jgi:hypothetical protein
MSYCRWSSDDHRCDVYVYEDVAGGWQIYVAGRTRRLRDGTHFPPHVDMQEDFDGWFNRHREVSDIINERNEGVLWDWEMLPESHAGASYNEPSPGECADRLEGIRAAGFNVPQYAIDALRAEQAAAMPIEQKPNQ